ncbi:hypothetical protein G4Y79_22975 [Phototrophicus methaneseepsis]|uniref:Uncharacterized protein n=1 Tax=Phototrophicus methaneseepsis TaxID=2710758 RepID=A0A7S8IEJ7_9CHLR|nr:hypothetical protein [Phototrophicus methaneseepsis]QPC82514.1 hypothetical protein G4Y79_22975 [Phototrophicus methaneseepsis]
MTNVQPSTERDLLASVRAAWAIHAYIEVLDAVTELACLYIEQGLTQEGADVLAFVLRQQGLPDDLHKRAVTAYEDLEASICPRVLLDAQDFASKATLWDIVEYVLAGEPGG